MASGRVADVVTWHDVRQWRTDPLTTSGDDLNKAKQTIVGQQQELTDSAVPKSWHGEGADAAKQKASKLADQLQDHVASISALGAGVDRVTPRVEHIVRSSSDLDDRAGTHQFKIGANGDVEDVAPPKGGHEAPEDEKAEREERERLKKELETDAKQILRTADDIASDLGSVLDQVQAGKVGDGDGSGGGTLAAAAKAGAGVGIGAMDTVMPPPGGDPAANHAWWQTLDHGEREWLIKNRSDRVGSMDGVPCVNRDQANRIRLSSKKEVLEQRISDLQTKMKDPDNTDPDVHDRLAAQLTHARTSLNGLRAIDDRLTSNTTSPASAHYLLDFSTKGNGQAIVAAGNPDLATHTATYVPGTYGSLGGIKGDLDRMDKMRDAANENGDGKTSVITWMGYDAPQNIVPEATEDRYADNAEGKLASFQEGLGVTHHGSPSTNTLVGHSYGTTVVGHTLRDHPGLNVDRAVMVASPGVGVDKASDLHIGADNVYSTTAKHDIIHVPAGINGTDPVNPVFGGRVFQSAPGTEGPWYTDGYSSAAHSEYWNRDNPALDSMGRIIAGGQP